MMYAADPNVLSRQETRRVIVVSEKRSEEEVNRILDEVDRLLGRNPGAGLEEVETVRAEAVEAWKDIVATPARDVTKRLLPIFYEPETFHAIPLVAKGKLAFLVIATSDLEAEGVQVLLDDMEVSREQYQIQRPDLEGLSPFLALARAQEEFAHYEVYPVDPNQLRWLQDLLDRLKQEGVVPLGDITPSLQATARYFGSLA